MFIRDRASLVILLAASLAGTVYAKEPAESPHLDRTTTVAEIERSNLTVTGKGDGLPPGAGSVMEGRATFVAKCQACHGMEGRGGIADRLTGGIGTLTSAKPVRTIASYWPYAPTVFDYIRRAMPLNAPQSLTDREVYGLVAYLLAVDGIVAKTSTLDAGSLPLVKMPNRRGFVGLRQKDFDGSLAGPSAGSASGS